MKKRAKRDNIGLSVPIYDEASSNDEDFSSGSDDEFNLHHSMDSSVSSYLETSDKSISLDDSLGGNQSCSPTHSLEVTTPDSSNSEVTTSDTSKTEKTSPDSSEFCDNDSVKSAYSSAPSVASTQSNNSSTSTSSGSNSLRQNEEVEFEMVPGKRLGSSLLYSFNESMF